MDQSHVPSPLYPLAKTFQPPCLPDPWPLTQSSFRNPSPFLPSPRVNVAAPADYSLATPTPNSVSLGPFPCPAQLPQTGAVHSGHQQRAAMKQSYVHQSTQALDKMVASLAACLCHFIMSMLSR
ncbi:unnamed protein product [Gadus morhua 'NCC']